MSVIYLHECLRARISQMADEHMQMQEAIMGLPHHEVAAACARLEQHAVEMSRLARRIENLAVPNVPDVSEDASPLTPHPLPSPPEDQ